MIRSLLLGLAAGSLAFAQALAGPEEAKTFVDSLVGDLKSAAETHGEGSAEVRDLLEEELATDAIGAFLIKGSVAENATPEERARYEELFPRFIAAAFAEEIGQLTARRIDVDRSLERRPGDIIVQSSLYDQSGNKRASIDWRVRVLDDGEHKLLDVMVERISPLITRRQTFSERAENGGMGALLAHMEETIANADGAGN
jgi:phospholipid transport system substrate-binding protein